MITRADIDRVAEIIVHNGWSAMSLLHVMEHTDMLPDGCNRDTLAALAAVTGEFSPIPLTGWRAISAAYIQGDGWAFYKLSNNTALRCLVEQAASFVIELCQSVPEDDRKDEAVQFFIAAAHKDLRAEECSREGLAVVWDARSEYLASAAPIPSEWLLVLEMITLRQLYDR